MNKEKLIKDTIEKASKIKDETEFHNWNLGVHMMLFNGNITEEEYNYILKNAKYTKEVEDLLEPWSDEHFTEENDPLIVGVKGRK